MVSVKCRACGHTTSRTRTPSRCEHCGAKFAVVGGELVYGEEQQKSKPKPVGAKVEKKRLELEPAPEKETPKEEPKEELYDCGSCGAAGVIRKGAEKCPKCGVVLDWDSVSEG